MEHEPGETLRYALHSGLRNRVHQIHAKNARIHLTIRQGKTRVVQLQSSTLRFAHGLRTKSSSSVMLRNFLIFLESSLLLVARQHSSEPVD